MPCCTLIAFVLSQCSMAAGAVRTRLFGWATPVGTVKLAGLRWQILSLALLFEIAIGAASAPYVFTLSGRSAAAQSFGATWHVCRIVLGGSH
jgi:hypothetical protein